MLTITYGVGNSITKPEDSFRTIEQVLNDTSIQTVLNFDPAQVDPRVNGQIVDPGTPITAGMRIDLVKKAGRKSAEMMNSDQQLKPLGVNCETIQLVKAHARAALEPVYDDLSKAESDSAKAVAAAQREVLKGCKPFAAYVDRIIEALVNREYLDNACSIPAEVREELDAIASAASEALQPKRQIVSDAELAADAWSRAVEADLRMCLVVPEQRSVLAKALKSNPLKAWDFSAKIA